MKIKAKKLKIKSIVPNYEENCYFIYFQDSYMVIEANMDFVSPEDVRTIVEKKLKEKDI